MAMVRRAAGEKPDLCLRYTSCRKPGFRQICGRHDGREGTRVYSPGTGRAGGGGGRGGHGIEHGGGGSGGGVGSPVSLTFSCTMLSGTSIPFFLMCFITSSNDTLSSSLTCPSGRVRVNGEEACARATATRSTHKVVAPNATNPTARRERTHMVPSEWPYRRVEVILHDLQLTHVLGRIVSHGGQSGGGGGPTTATPQGQSQSSRIRSFCSAACARPDPDFYRHTRRACGCSGVTLTTTVAGAGLRLEPWQGHNEFLLPYVRNAQLSV